MSFDLDAFKRTQAFRDTVDRAKPMGAARIVRRERYAWPGGYPLVLVLTDGAVLCPTCVTAEWGSISWGTRHYLRNGWEAAGLDILEAPDAEVICDHCGTTIAEGPDA